jgi:hypothetical protein
MLPPAANEWTNEREDVTQVRGKQVGRRRNTPSAGQRRRTAWTIYRLAMNNNIQDEASPPGSVARANFSQPFAYVQNLQPPVL